MNFQRIHQKRVFFVTEYPFFIFEIFLKVQKYIDKGIRQNFYEKIKKEFDENYEEYVSPLKYDKVPIEL